MDLDFILQFDGASKGNPGKGGAGWAVLDAKTKMITACGASHMPHATNNEAEYTALIDGLQHLVDEGTKGKRIGVQGDSKLVVMQVKGKWKCKAEHLKPHMDTCKALVKAAGVLSADIEWIPRESNKVADHMSNVGVDMKREGVYMCKHGTGVTFKELKETCAGDLFLA